jgi:hypothetical protein
MPAFRDANRGGSWKLIVHGFKSPKKMGHIMYACNNIKRNKHIKPYLFESLLDNT